MAKARKRGPGRPPAGPGGTRVSQFRHQLTTRLTGSDFHLLISMSTAKHASYRDIVSDALKLYAAQMLTRKERQSVEEMTKNAQNNCSRCHEEQSA